MRVQVLNIGRLAGNERFFRRGWPGLLRRAESVEFPAYAFLVEHAGGLLLVDTGINPAVRIPRSQRRVVPTVVERRPLWQVIRDAGVDAGDLDRVVVTHLDWDHVGGIADVPRAQVLVHRPELEFAATRMGRLRFQSALWPDRPALVPYDLDPEPFGPFPISRRLTEDGSIVLVPLPGHSVGQVGVAIRVGAVFVLLAADHVLRQDWFLEDRASGNLRGLGAFHPRAAVETSRRLLEWAERERVVLVPSHDAEAPARLAAMEPLPVGGAVEPVAAAR